MEYRKIIGFGGNSHVVSLPKNWMVVNNLRKGDVVSLEQENGALVLSANNLHSRHEPRTIEIDAEMKSIEAINAEIVAAYLNNFDTIEIFSNNLKADAPQIKSILRNLAGLEIMMHTTKRIVAKDLLNISEASIKSIIRRMDNIARFMIDDTTECIEGIDHYEDINQRDIDMNRLYFLMLRVVRNAYLNPSIMKEFKTSAWEILLERNIATKIEKIADHQKRIARYMRTIHLNPKSREELKCIHETIKKCYLKVMDACYKRDKSLALEVNVSNRERIQLCNEFLIRNSEAKLRRDGIRDGVNIEKDPIYWTDLARIVENLKAMCSSIKYISRSVIDVD